MPFIRLWVHLVWSTKKREPYLHESIRSTVFEHMQKNGAAKKIQILEVNGYTDHVHCLVSLKSTQSVSSVVKLIKGESSRWINEKELGESHFQWQKGYYAVSVGLAEINRIRRYIQFQEEHHSKNTFADEIRKLPIVRKNKIFFCPFIAGELILRQ